ncbi:MAG: aminodeoxychorismate/anthranilate synthase component II [Pirellulales bacterium]|nr:aminodeoxychorismate/anthranilate synthase component II [Pirellulales bacterium]
MSILLIDNYDSFVHNLARYFERLGQSTHAVRNDAIDVAGVRRLRPAVVVLSPGPCTPREAGCSLDLVRELYRELPILGICLGHQAIAEAFGANIVRAREPVHGRASQVRHGERGIFTGLPNPLVVGRYHSLVVDPATLPAELEITATTTDGAVMALAHRELPLVGLQFHPESILTEHGYELLAAYLQTCGIASRSPRPAMRDERPETAPAPFVLPQHPVTF